MGSAIIHLQSNESVVATGSGFEDIVWEIICWSTIVVLNERIGEAQKRLDDARSLRGLLCLSKWGGETCRLLGEGFRNYGASQVRLLVWGPWGFGVAPSETVAGGEPEYIPYFVVAVSAANFRGGLKMVEGPICPMENESQAKFFSSLMQYAAGSCFVSSLKGIKVSCIHYLKLLPACT